MRKNLKQILIMDPQGDRQDALALRLADNFSVIVCRTIEEGWKSLIEHKPDLVVMEPMLPHGTEGFHLVWKLRRHPDRQLSRTPVIVVSNIRRATGLNLFPSHSDGHYRAHDYLPVQAFLDKPSDERLVMQTIEQVLREHGSSSLLKQPVGGSDEPWD